MTEISSSPQTKTLKIALIGNPNVGKSTIFNQLTGLNQKIGNYPGVTVDKKTGKLNVGDQTYEIIDLPGTYSLYPNSEDEIIVHRVLNQWDPKERPDFILMVIDSLQLSRGLFLASQLIDLGLPMALVLNMTDLAEKSSLVIKNFDLYKQMGLPILTTDARKQVGLDKIRELIQQQNFLNPGNFIEPAEYLDTQALQEVKEKFELTSDYRAYQLLRFGPKDKGIAPEKRKWLAEKIKDSNLNLEQAHLEETRIRYQKITEILDLSTYKKDVPPLIESKFDKIALHPIYGYLVFAGILLLIFQSIFAWASVPMDLIDGFFADASGWVSDLLPAGPLTSLLAEGVIPGIGGILIFVPQIALLFGFLAILEDTGYMSRVVFLMDRWMRPFGLHGKSIVPLVSGVACAIPGVMATRTIGNWKEKIITILVTPLMSCSARLPVYIILIGLVVPDEPVLGFINLQALTLFGLYVLGVLGVLFTAYGLKLILKTAESSFLMVELPTYKTPRWKDVLLTMYYKSRTFITEAGKIILAISIVLWILGSYGPPSRMQSIRDTQAARLAEADSQEAIEELEMETASLLLENSFIGILGRGIEPLIKPLGYDWKIGIALITSFAAREVFVSTIATIYSIGGDPEDDLTIRQKLEIQRNPSTGEKVFNKATAFSLMVFYAFAMQCMSTLAIVYRETKSWRWPIIQTVYMTALAYISAFLTYQLFS